MKVGVIILLALCTFTGCVVTMGGAWRGDGELDKLREQGCIDVVSSDGRYTGLAELPNTNEWYTETLTNMGVQISLPTGIGISDYSDWTTVLLYKIHGHYMDSRWASGIEVRKLTQEEKDEEVERLNRIIKDTWGENDARSIQTRWDRLTFHAETEQGYGVYRRDVKCPDGSILRIRGRVEGLRRRYTDQDLSLGMVAVLRRIMDSVEPLPLPQQEAE